MTGRRFFIEPGAVAEDRIALSAELVRHIFRVLRLAVGDEVVLLDGLGNHFRCRLEALSDREGAAAILERWRDSDSGFDIQLIQALPKGEKYDLVLQKGTELGISRFTPVWSERSLVQIDRQRAAKKQLRWQRIVTEAARQSSRHLLPGCDQPVALAEALADCRQELKLMLWEAGSRPLAEVLPPLPPANAAILVGPEGGFSEKEADLARQAGFRPVHLGPRILRTETAGFAVTAVLEYLYGDFGIGNRATD